MKSLFLYLSIFLPLFAVAQSDFKDGFILITEQDTVYGQIDNKNFQQNALHCDFRKNENEAVKRYYPKDLFAYRFTNGKYYISKSIEKDSTSTSFFFEYLINGELDVYFLQTSKKNTYYISDDGIILNKLKYSNDIIDRDGQKMLYENKQFIGLLDYYTGSYPELKTDIRSISAPNHKNMIKLSKKYHDLACKDSECIIYEKKAPQKIKIDFSVSYNKTINKSSYPSFRSNIFFQLTQNNERFYIGLGIGSYKPIPEESKNIILVPLSINYIHPKDGISPLFSYSFDLPFISPLQTLSIGAQYKFWKAAFFCKGGLHVEFLNPYSKSIIAGIMLDLN